MKENQEIKFDTLTPEDIEIRIGQKKEKMTMFLLYKNARVDMNILDKTVGAANWQRDHKELKGNLFCGVGIRFDEGWVWKWDCGTESNTEKEKGEASDSFKRACVNWGIGRELYSTPRVQIWNNKLDFNGNYLNTPLEVAHIAYDEARKICDLTIINADTLEEVWKMRNGEIVIGVGAKTGKRADSTASNQKADKVPTQESKPAETQKKAQITGKVVLSGKCRSILEHLSNYNPDDALDWNKGLAPIEAKYDISTDGYNTLEKVVKQMRGQANA